MKETFVCWRHVRRYEEKHWMSFWLIHRDPYWTSSSPLIFLHVQHVIHLKLLHKTVLCCHSPFWIHSRTCVCVCVSKKWFQIMWWLLLVFWEMLFTSPFLWSFFQWLAPPGYFSMDLLQRQTQTNSQLLCKSRSIHIWLQISTSSIILILLIEELLNLVIGSLSIA